MDTFQYIHVSFVKFDTLSLELVIEYRTSKIFNIQQTADIRSNHL